MPKTNRNPAPVAVKATPRAPAAQATSPAKPQPATSSTGWVKPTTGRPVGGGQIDSGTARTAFWHSPYTNADAKAAQDGVLDCVLRLKWKPRER